MANDDDIPVYSSDLIDWLKANVKTPTFPMTAKGAQGLDDATVRLGCFQAGACGLVEQLVAWRQATEENHGAEAPEDSEGDDAPLSYPEIFDSTGRVAEIKSPVRVVGDDVK
jgi:hypothetical protein